MNKISAVIGGLIFLIFAWFFIPYNNTTGETMSMIPLSQLLKELGEYLPMILEMFK